MSDDLFLGTWQMQPEQNDYQQGDPPAKGTYTIANNPDGEGYLVSMAWTTIDGRDVEMSYTAIPDGIDHPYENPDIADTVSMTRVDENILDSDVKKGGAITAYARRELSSDGQTMTVTQSGPKSDGDWFDNVSVYVRKS